MLSFIEDRIQQAITVKEQMLQNKDLSHTLVKAIELCVTAFKNKQQILLCGNGGSAADAQHIAAELTGRFYKDRAPLNAEALHVNSSYLTAVANDYSYDLVYARLVEAKGKKGDVFIGISTSGNSENVVQACIKAKEMGMHTIAFTGESQGRLDQIADYTLKIPSKDTPRIQECHILIGHILCEAIEQELFGNK